MPLFNSHLRLVLVGGVLIYTAGFLLWYSATPLGLYPVLDGRELLELAHRIASNELPAEAFYRAPLYPAVLACFIKAGLAYADLPLVARLLNGLLHVLSTCLVWAIAQGLWRRQWAAAVATVLFGFNPVVLHFAADPLDITFAMTLMLAGIYCGLRALETSTSAHRGPTVLASLAFALAVLARPQMLVLVAAWLVLLLVRTRRFPGRLPAVAFAAMPIALVLALMGLINFQLAGDYRVLPWQGAFNLWAANGPDANGRYFVQVTRMAAYTEGINPARVESERLYRERNPQGPGDYVSMSRYWYARTLAAVKADPARWLRLLASKVWYLLNNFEQYDIKTYHLHKASSAWLRWNPLCWAVVLAAGLAGLAAGRQQAQVRAVAWFALIYAGGLLLAYVSGRFRLPLVPLLAVLAGGIMCPATLPAAWRRAAVVGVVLGSSLWPLPATDTDKTLVQDYLLMSRAETVLGMYDEAVAHAREALARMPGNEAARELICVSEFNRWLRGAQRDDALPVASCEAAAPISPVARRVLGIAYWRLGRDIDALALWQALIADGGADSDAALAALIMTTRVAAGSAPLDWSRAEEYDDVLLLALASKGNLQAAAALERRMSAQDIAMQTDELRRTFSRNEHGARPPPD